MCVVYIEVELQLSELYSESEWSNQGKKIQLAFCQKNNNNIHGVKHMLQNFSYSPKINILPTMKCQLVNMVFYLEMLGT